MAIEISHKCIKMELPNGKVVDILSSVFQEIGKWLQIQPSLPESGGYIVGYKHKKTGNISLEAVSHPYPCDRHGREYFTIRDLKHWMFLSKMQRIYKSYYMGVWHTHPQRIPEPSEVDWNDWYQTLREDKTGCNYIFFIIAGTHEARVWVGNFITMEILEIFECQKVEGIYKKVSENSIGGNNDNKTN